MPLLVKDAPERRCFVLSVILLLQWNRNRLVDWYEYKCAKFVANSFSKTEQVLTKFIRRWWTLDEWLGKLATKMQPNLRALYTFRAHMTLTEFNYSSLKEWRKNSADHTKTILLHNEVIQAPAKIAGGKFHWNQIASQHYVSHYKVMYDSRTKACVQVDSL